MEALRVFDKFRVYAAKRLLGGVQQSAPEFGEAAFGGPTRLFHDVDKAISTYNPTGLIRTRGYSIIDQMRIDDQIKAATVFKKHAVISTGWEVVPPEGKSENWKPAKFVDTVLKEIPGTLNTLLMSTMTCMDYGFSVTEKLWVQDGAAIKLAGLKTRAPHWWTFDLDAHGNIHVLRQNMMEMPAEKFIVWSYDKEFDNPYGNSDLLAAYRPWWAKDNAYKFMLMLMERMGIPPVFALYDPNAYPNVGTTIRSDLKSVLDKMQAATSGIIPRPQKDSLEMWTPELADNVTTVFIPAIEMLNKDISRALLMPGLLGLTSEGAVGSMARSKVQFDMFMLVIDKLRQDIEEFIMHEQIVKPMCDYNFAGLTDYPRFRFLPLSDNIRLELFNTWTGLVNEGVVRKTNQDEAHVREVMQFPPRDETGKDDIVASAPVANQPPGAGPGKAPIGKPPLGKPAGDQKLFAKDTTDYAAIRDSLNAAEAKAKDALVPAVVNWRDKIIKLIVRKYDPTKLLEIETPSTTGMVSILKDHFSAVYTLGRQQALPDKKYKVGVTGQATTAYLRSKADFVISGIDDRVTQLVSLILQNAVKQGKPLGQVKMEVNELFQQYVGDPGIIKDGEQLQPYRIETIIRTNTTDAYNQGRLVQFRDPTQSEFIQAVQFSAVMDGRTTEVCSQLNGRLFNKDDPQLSTFTPPLHFNCRSILVARFIDETLNAEDFLTVKDAASAIDKAGAGFV